MSNDSDTGTSSRDGRLGRRWTRLVALVPLSVAAGISIAGWRDRDRYESLVDALGTGFLLLPFLLLGVWLWQRGGHRPDPSDRGSS